LRDWPASDATTHVFLAVRAADLRLSLEPFILFHDPAGDHIVMGVLVGSAKVNRLPAVRLERLLEHLLKLRRHLGDLRTGLLDICAALRV